MVDICGRAQIFAQQKVIRFLDDFFDEGFSKTQVKVIVSHVIKDPNQNKKWVGREKFQLRMSFDVNMKFEF